MRPSSILRTAALAAGIGLVFGCLGCRALPGGHYVSHFATKTFQPGRISREELRQALVQFASGFEATVVATADTITAGTQDPVIQRRALRWKIGMTPAINQAAFQPDAVAAYVAMLTLATSLDEYLTTGIGQSAFGDQQRLAIESSAEIVAGVRALGQRFLAEKELERVTGQVRTLVAQQPIRGEFVSETVQKLVTTSTSSPTFEWLTAIPMSPFRALQGVDEGAQAIREFNETAVQIARTINGMPRLIRWNLQLLALDVSDQSGVAASIESLETVARSAESLSRTAESLPESLHALLSEAERTGDRLAPLSSSLERSATALAEAGKAWGALVAELSKPPADPSQPTRPFDIREWESAATKVASAAAELHALLESAGTLASSNVLAAPLEDLTGRVERLEAGSRDFVDRVAWRGVQLILLVFALLFAYRFVSHALAIREKRAR